MAPKHCEGTASGASPSSSASSPTTETPVPELRKLVSRIGGRTLPIVRRSDVDGVVILPGRRIAEHVFERIRRHHRPRGDDHRARIAAILVSLAMSPNLYRQVAAGRLL